MLAKGNLETQNINLEKKKLFRSNPLYFPELPLQPPSIKKER